jgi:hypothetical protein
MKFCLFFFIFQAFFFDNSSAPSKAFYLPHYEGIILLVSRKMKNFFADFHFLGHDLSESKFRLRKVIPWVLLSKFHRITNPTAFLITMLGPGTKFLWSIDKNAVSEFRTQGEFSIKFQR